MGQIQMTNRLSDMSWFFGIELARFTFADGAKPTVASTDVTTQHKGRGAVRPALKNIRATGLLANRMQVQAINKLKYMVLISWIAQADLEPFGFRLSRLGIADYSKFSRQLKVSSTNR